jgi:hypothetical protein
VAYGHILAGTIKTINHISTPKANTTEVIPKILKEVHAEAAEVSFRKKIIPKTLSSIAPRDARSTTNQGVGLRTI